MTDDDAWQMLARAFNAAAVVRFMDADYARELLTLCEETLARTDCPPNTQHMIPLSPEIVREMTMAWLHLHAR